MNNDEMSYLDPLIKMALIHQHFESIHPFADENGSFLNVLCLTRTIGFCSLFVTRARGRTGFFMLDAGAYAADLGEGIGKQMQREASALVGLPKIYGQDLLNNLFRHMHGSTMSRMNSASCARRPHDISVRSRKAG